MLNDEDDDYLMEVFRNPRRQYLRLDAINAFSDEQFKMRFRLDKVSAMNIVDRIASIISYDSNRWVCFNSILHAGNEIGTYVLGR